MQITRTKPAMTQMSALSAELNTLNGPCVGCEGCNGLCEALIDALMLPNIILSKKREPQ